jgi:transposase
MITPEQRAEIRRLFHAEHWKIGTIATQLSVHPDTVREALEVQKFQSARSQPRRTIVDPYLPFIRDVLEKYPRLRATRIWQMIKGRGYAGSVLPVRRTLVHLRPQCSRKAYLRLSALPGAQAQADWGHFGTVAIGRGRRPLSCFVMVLAYSRAIHAVFTLDQTLESFVRSHLAAFAYFCGVPREIAYDNLKSAVLERYGNAIRFQPRLLDLAGHYHFAPRICSPGQPNQKGRVERAIGFLRTSFFAARSFRSVPDLNAQFVLWRDEIAHVRKLPGDGTRSVTDAFAEERGYLLPLPEHPFETDLVRAVSSGKTPHVRFDRNLYSIPHKLVRMPLTLVAGASIVRVLDGAAEVAHHARSYDTGVTIEDPAHVADLIEQRKAAATTTTRDRLLLSVPELAAFFELLAMRGDPMGRHTTWLMRLLQEHGAPALRDAVLDVLGRGAVGAASVAHLLERRRRMRGVLVPVPIELPNHPGVRELSVTPHRLEDYDELGKNTAAGTPDRTGQSHDGARPAPHRLDLAGPDLARDPHALESDDAAGGTRQRREEGPGGEGPAA